MPKATKSKAKQAVPSDYPSLVQARKKTTSEHLRAANTNAAYQRHIDASRKWIAEARLRWSAPTRAPDSPATTYEVPPQEIQEVTRGFEEVPNQYSPEALAIYITQKCVEEECKISTADQVRAAWKALWDGV
jgi:hypothetical protein